MKQSFTATLTLLTLFLSPLTGLTTEVAVSHDASRLAAVDSGTVLPDHTMATIAGALSGRAKCALAFAGLGIGLFAGSLATGGIGGLAVAGAFAGNVAAICLL